jgi:hypothetical protein
MLHASVPWLAAALPAGALCVTCVTCGGLGQCVCEHGLVRIAVSAAGCQTTAGQSVPFHHCCVEPGAKTVLMPTLLVRGRGDPAGHTTEQFMPPGIRSSLTRSTSGVG